MGSKLLIGGIIVIAAGLYGTTSQNGNFVQVNPAPDFTLQKLGGGTISLSEFKGKKPVVVDFWASWCPNCRRDMPKLSGFYEKYKDKVEVIGVNLQERESTVQDFISSRGISFPIALDPLGQASNAFGIQYTNIHVLVDINGNLVRTIPGDIREVDIVSLIEQTASENQSYIPDAVPCELASAEDAGVCKNEAL